MTPRPIADRFWARVEIGDGCWLWQGTVSSWGYGFLSVDRKMRHAHRVSWEIHNGPIPPGMMVCHHCDIRNCVRPDHLFLGTAKDNVADMIAKGRRGNIPPPLNARGQDHPAARLSDLEVASIREAATLGQETRRAVARRFGISHTYVGMLARGEKRT